MLNTKINDLSKLEEMHQHKHEEQKVQLQEIKKQEEEETKWTAPKEISKYCHAANLGDFYLSNFI